MAGERRLDAAVKLAALRQRFDGFILKLTHEHGFCQAGTQAPTVTIKKLPTICQWCEGCVCTIKEQVTQLFTNATTSGNRRSVADANTTHIIVKVYCNHATDGADLTTVILEAPHFSEHEEICGTFNALRWKTVQLQITTDAEQTFRFSGWIHGNNTADASHN